MPWSARRTPAASSARSTSKRYQDSSQATAIVTTLPSVADGRTATIGAPSERATPATVRGCELALKRSSARAIFRSALVGTACTLRGSRGGASGSRGGGAGRGATGASWAGGAESGS